ncbi:DUF1304 domain-containing protein [Deinococcus ruber]|uniref:Membrane protein n=1 Tax=Deinococcus ruber TaxID=1848197 RepID=A0A918C4L0_9DEIO|nr:DUF1304 domain-containing protein [Deinococcus ruber]GGR05552.1 membrane protein [Deinococcus ruber]
MNVVANILIGLLAVLHVYIVILEMALWTTPRVRATFGTTAEFAEQSRTMAGNQGLYNGFLAAGFIWALFAPAELAHPLKVFFSLCVVIAGLYGGFTVSRRIFVVQMVPGLLALIFVLLSGR